jgi:hypothetical protein
MESCGPSRTVWELVCGFLQAVELRLLVNVCFLFPAAPMRQGVDDATEGGLWAELLTLAKCVCSRNVFKMFPRAGIPLS